MNATETTSVTSTEAPLPELTLPAGFMVHIYCFPVTLADEVVVQAYPGNLRMIACEMARELGAQK